MTAYGTPLQLLLVHTIQYNILSRFYSVWLIKSFSNPHFYFGVLYFFFCYKTTDS